MPDDGPTTFFPPFFFVLFLIFKKICLVEVEILKLANMILKP